MAATTGIQWLNGRISFGLLGALSETLFTNLKEEIQHKYKAE
jgi:hypothetical protein